MTLRSYVAFGRREVVALLLLLSPALESWPWTLTLVVAVVVVVVVFVSSQCC